MKTRTLGASGMEVSEIAFGAMNFGFPSGPSADDATKMVLRALDAGVTLIDTADVYSGGESERLVGLALRGRRDEVLLATKFGLPVGGEPSQSGASSRWIKQAVESSLRRLGTDYIDLYQLHRPDYSTPIAETLSALSDLVQEGKVRAIGSSTFPAELIVSAQWSAEKGGYHRFISEQPRYSILNRRPEAHVFPVIQDSGMGALTYAPLASGWLSGRKNPTQGLRANMESHVFDLASSANRAKFLAVEQLRDVAADAGLPLSHLALAFVRSHPAVSSVLIGPRTPEQLTDLLNSADITLEEAILDRIDGIVPPGTELNPADNYDTAIPAIEDKRIRRR